MTDMITWILKKRTFSEKEIREIIKRDLPNYILLLKEEVTTISKDTPIEDKVAMVTAVIKNQLPEYHLHKTGRRKV